MLQRKCFFRIIFEVQSKQTKETLRWCAENLKSLLVLKYYLILKLIWGSLFLYSWFIYKKVYSLHACITFWNRLIDNIYSLSRLILHQTSSRSKVCNRVVGWVVAIRLQIYWAVFSGLFNLMKFLIGHKHHLFAYLHALHLLAATLLVFNDSCVL